MDRRHELVARFREPEENVKADVFAAYCDLLRQVRVCQGIRALYLMFCFVGSSLSI
jgi:hypothetical protein